VVGEAIAHCFDLPPNAAYDLVVLRPVTDNDMGPWHAPNRKVWRDTGLHWLQLLRRHFRGRNLRSDLFPGVPGGRYKTCGKGHRLGGRGGEDIGGIQVSKRGWGFGHDGLC